MEINWYGAGYAGDVEHIARELAKIGVTISEKKQEVGICFGYPDQFHQLDVHKVKIGYTTWETDTVPTAFVEACNKLDALCVTSTFACSTFRKAGVKVPIKVVYLGVDTDEVPFIERPLINKGEKYHFLQMGTLTIRKNPGHTLGAFLDLFKDDPNVRLILKSQDGTIGHITLPYENVQIWDERSTREEINEFYKLADCFVFPSRGDGAGIPVMESMATGLPVITSYNTGMRDICDDSMNYSIKTMHKKPAQNFPKKWGDVGKWFEPDYEELKQLMRYVYDNREEAYNKGKRASEFIRDNRSYQQTAQTLLKVINERR
jgi:glycosyltransferase involved in cell wall biosynthesis